MTKKKNYRILKPAEKTTSTRNAVETAIDLSKDDQPWRYSHEIKPWQEPVDDKVGTQDFEENLERA